ncbi:hypothetical protein [Paucidesulfovibrio longus]|uniref:hypothetical protein n=1 Tax=Paucidesulfovibrio longus TaxID=889 RepID=UPI0003FBEA48|nr:hypothetical protein [Paucidesulfovibrio longus]
MSKQRKKFTAELKTRVALDALSNERTLSVIASKYSVHPQSGCPVEKAGQGRHHRFFL